MGYNAVFFARKGHLPILSRNRHTNPNVKNNHLMIFPFLYISSEIAKCQLSTPLKIKKNNNKEGKKVTENKKMFI